MPIEALQIVEPVGPGGNEIAAGLDAWKQYQRAQGLAFSQLMDLGRALLTGRKQALAEAGTNKPAGAPYIRAFRNWCEETGFGDVPTNWRMDLIWCAEHEAEVVETRAAHEAARSRGAPSANPRTMRQAVMKRRKVGAPRRRIGPTVGAMTIETLCAQISARLDGQSAERVLSDVAALVSVLEDATRRATVTG